MRMRSRLRFRLPVLLVAKALQRAYACTQLRDETIEPRSIDFGFTLEGHQLQRDLIDIINQIAPSDFAIPFDFPQPRVMFCLLSVRPAAC
jgi:hypothetical protein